MKRSDLKNFRATQEWIKGRIEYIEEYKSSINRLNSILSDMPKGTTEIQDKEAEKIVNLMDCIDELLNKIREINEKQNMIVNQLDKIKQPYRNILYKRYVQGKSLSEIATEMHYEYDYIRKLLSIALNIFDKEE